MAQSKLYRLTGIVLGRRDHGEADRLVTLLTPEGRFDVLAKGVRKPRSRKAGHVELFTTTQLLLSRVANSWDIVGQAEVLVVRERLQGDFRFGTYARYVAELVIRFFESESGDATLFQLVEDTLSALEAGAAPERLVRWYEQQVLLLAGFRPEWGMCVGDRGAELCLTPLHPRAGDTVSYGVDPERGGALCPDCFTLDVALRAVRMLSPSALSWLQALQRRSYAEITQFPLPESTSAELARVMDHYIAYHLEHRPATLRMLRLVER